MTARQLILDLLARDKTGPATSSAAHNLEDVGDAADGAAKSTEKLGKEADRAEDKVTRYGKSSRTAAEHVQHLDREIKLCERELQKLAVAFAEAETAADRADLSKGIRNTQNELAKLKKNKNVLKDLIPDHAPDQLGKEISTAVSKGASEGLSALAGPAAAALAPMLGAVVSAGVIGAAGVGGVIGGVLLAAKDPRVQAAGKALGQNLFSQLKQDADVFVAPVLKNIGKIEARFGTMNGKLKSIFSGSSNFLDPLVNGALDGVDGILGGVQSLVTKGKPVIDELGRTFAKLGNATGYALKTIAGGSDAAAKGLSDLSDDVSTAIRGTGWLVRGLTELYGVLSTPNRAFTDWLTKTITGVDRTTAEMSVASTVAGTFASVQEKLATTTLSEAEAAGKAGQQMQTYADAMDEAASKGRNLYDSQTDVAQAFADAEKAVDKNGKTLDLNSQKGRDNRKVLSDLASKLVENYDAYVKVNGEGGAAAGIATNNRNSFIKLATQFGLTKKAAEDLATQMGLLPTDKKTNFYANTHDAEARIAALKGSIGGVKGKTITVHVSVTGTERLDSLGHRIGGFKAAGGPVTAGKAYVVGEKRPEVFVPNQNGTIIPSISQFGAGTGAGAMSGGGSAAVTFDFKNADSVMGTALVKLIRVSPALRSELKALLA